MTNNITNYSRITYVSCKEYTALSLILHVLYMTFEACISC